MRRLPHAVLVGLTLAAAPAVAQETVKLERVAIETALHPPYASLRTTHELPDQLTIGDVELPVERKRDALLVAVAPGKKPAKRVRGEGSLEVRLARERTAPKLGIHFVPQGEDAWTYRAAEAARLRIDGVTVDLIDADVDGRITTDGVDAYRCGDATCVVPLTESVWIGAVQVSLEPVAAGDTTATLTIAPAEGDRLQLDALRQLNDLRARNGLPGVALSEELSAGCSAHASYLKQNDWSGLTNPHGQVEGRPGYSEAGVRAARAGAIMGRGHDHALGAFYDSYYHRAALVDPFVPEVGISAGVRNISVIDAKTGRRTRTTDDPWPQPSLVPAHGSSGVPTNFCRDGEQPEPCDRPTTRGFPLTVLFDAPDHGVTEFEGRLVRLDDGEEEPVETIEPVLRRYSRLFGLIPASPLRGGSTYVVRYSWKRGGETQTAEATFRTR